MAGSLNKRSFTKGFLKVQSCAQYSLIFTFNHCLKSFLEVRAVITNMLMILSFTSIVLLTFIHWLLTLSSVLTLWGNGWLVTGYDCWRWAVCWLCREMDDWQQAKAEQWQNRGSFGWSLRRVSVSQDDHLRVGNLDISFKRHVKNLGVYIDATLSTVKHIDHISRSAYLEIRKNWSIRHLLTTKATAQLMCSLVLSRLDGCNSLLVDIYCDQMYRLQKVQNNAAKAVFGKNRHKHVRPLLKALHWLPVTREYFEDSHFCFPFFSWYPATISVIMSLCIHFFSHTHFQFRWGKSLFLVQDGNLRALVTGRTLFRLP